MSKRVKWPKPLGDIQTITSLDNTKLRKINTTVRGLQIIDTRDVGLPNKYRCLFFTQTTETNLKLIIGFLKIVLRITGQTLIHYARQSEEEIFRNLLPQQHY